LEAICKAIWPPKKTQVVKTIEELETQRIRESLEGWKEKNMSHLSSSEFASFKFIDFTIIGNDIWAAAGGWTKGGHRGYGRIVHSFDRGQTWELQWQDDKLSASKVYFSNNREGLVAAGKRILETKNGGENWNFLLSIEYMPDPIWKRSWAINTLNIEEIIIENRRRIIVRLNLLDPVETFDGGKTWDYAIIKGTYKSDYKPIRFRTQDKGVSWQKVNEDKY